jgi:hypothetical protein
LPFHDSAASSFFTLPSISPHAVLDAVVDDEVQFFISEAVVLGEDAVYFIYDKFGVFWIEFIIDYLPSSLVVGFFALRVGF